MKNQNRNTQDSLQAMLEQTRMTFRTVLHFQFSHFKLLLAFSVLFLISCTKFDAQDPDSVTGYTWEDKAGASSITETLSSSADGTSSVSGTSFSSIAGESSAIVTSSSSAVASSSAIEPLSSSVVGASSAIVTLSSSVVGSSSTIVASSSSVTETSSSSVTVSSSVATLNPNTCTYSASGMSDGSTGTLECTEKTYATVVIGTQTWMAENLAWLSSVNANTDISSTDRKYYVYGYEGTSVSAAQANSNYITYGVLYNFPAAIRACPSGWHLPDTTDWNTLVNYLGQATAGTQLKSNSTLWVNGGVGSNTSKFSALPGGDYGNKEFADIGYFGFWWTATPLASQEASTRNMETNFPGVNSNPNQQSSGFSVRCLKDN